MNYFSLKKSLFGRHSESYLSDLFPGARATPRAVLLCHFFCPKDGRLCNVKYTTTVVTVVLAIVDDAVNVNVSLM